MQCAQNDAKKRHQQEHLGAMKSQSKCSRLQYTMCTQNLSCDNRSFEKRLVDTSDENSIHVKIIIESNYLHCSHLINAEVADGCFQR